MRAAEVGHRVVGSRWTHTALPDVALAGDNDFHDDFIPGKERLCLWFLW